MNTNEKLDRLLVMVGALLIAEVFELAELDDLQAQVSNTTGVMESAKALLDGLAAKLDAAIASGNPAALVALRDALKNETDTLAAAVATDTR